MSEEKKRYFFYDVAKDLYDDANKTPDDLDGKANNLFTLNSALITVVTSVGFRAVLLRD